ncbi:sensor histidine kinase [Cerasicoccus fimbriatus]|uniref:sensor histidine kinase n=1 Tax=Cerasicoccus fimbriatus TaxID=3014554 RepID=UPI0022B48C0B|nr:HAMP domain-containing sensor histidine kinase [Cerasicoccus sp. TK19100]
MTQQLLLKMHRLTPAMLGIVAGSLAFLVVSVCISLFYLLAVQTYDTRVRDRVEDLAMLAATVVDVESHAQLRDPALTDSEQHRKLLEPLVNIHRIIPEVHYLYTMIIQDGQQYFILDTAQDSRIDKLPDTESSAIMELFPTSNPHDSEARQALASGRPFVYPDYYLDDFGRFISAAAPLMRADGSLEGFVGVDYRISAYEGQLSQLRQTALIALLVGFIGSTLIGVISANQRARTQEQVRERIRAESEMRRAKEKAEAALDAKQELLSIAAHDLKNPLAAIIGVSDLMQMSLQHVPNRYIPDNTRTLFQKIPRYANNMLKIIDEVLKAETIDRIGMQVADKPFNATEAANEVVEFNRFASKKKNITIHYVCERSYFVLGDRDRIMEALDNLISNAVKYSPPNARVDVAMGCDLKQTMLRFSVTDEGPGLSDDDQAKLFQKFQKLTAKPTGDETSSGLGLSIVKHVVEAHGGRVFCESEEGFGATFIIELPIVNSQPLYASVSQQREPETRAVALPAG